jgi:hypothetical protein
MQVLDETLVSVQRGDGSHLIFPRSLPSAVPHALTLRWMMTAAAT